LRFFLRFWNILLLVSNGIEDIEINPKTWDCNNIRRLAS